MKLKVVVHEAEEGGFWAEVPAIPGCATQGETFEETSKSQRRVERSGSWKSRYESAVRARTRATRGRERMAPAKGQRQPPYLRQARQRGSAFDSDPRQPPAQAGPASPPPEARRHKRGYDCRIGKRPRRRLKACGW